MALHRVEIIAGKPAHVDKDKDPLEISKSGEDQVEWWSHSPDWAVRFPENEKRPFEQRVFSPSNSRSRKIIVDPGDHKYKYSVSIGQSSDDPVIIVRH